ncbi:MAG: Gfo/Idh/MocA family oxidoreductase, partial [Verrucomicrobiales bacterium]|nr:Gfo/Idh/MocA family oxidoreductase [Verrucomicrobiales bacterium]
MIQRHVRWGILGTATIARKNWRAMRDSGVAVVGAVASRDPAKSRAFVEACQAEVPFETTPRALGSYRELVESRDIDAVYVPLPTALRKEWVIRAAEAGKHVVCEKPCAPSAADLREMLTACRRSGVQFMDGVMFAHSSRFARVRERLADGKTVGEIRRLASGFSFRAGGDFEAGNIRADAALEPAGCLGDLGWYCIRFALEAMPDRVPRSVTGRILSEMRAPGATGAVPSEFSGELFYDGGVSLSFYCSFITENQQWVSVQGTTGRLTVDDFVLPFAGERIAFDVSKPEYHIRGCDFRMEPHGETVSVMESAHGSPSAQEARLY